MLARIEALAEEARKMEAEMLRTVKEAVAAPEWQEIFSTINKIQILYTRQDELPIRLPNLN